MADPDDTAGAGNDLDEDTEPLEATVQSSPDKEAIDEPTTDSEQEAKESAWMVRELTSITVISILGVVLLALALMQATGLVDLLGPLADSEGSQWAVFAVLALGVVAIFLWSRRGV